MHILRGLVVMFFLLGFFFSFEEICGAGPEESRMILKMATNAPRDIGVEIWVRTVMTPRFVEITKGEVVIDWYHGGVMGDNRDWVSKMAIDQLQGAALDGSGIHLVCPEAYVLQLPFMFNDFEEVAYVKGKIRKRMDATFWKNGYKMLTLFDQSFDKIYSKNIPIRTPKDFAKMRFASYAGVLQSETFRALGAKPIFLNVPEIVASFRAGICDGVMTPALWFVGSQLYTDTKYVTVSQMRYTPACTVLTIKAWQSIPEKHHTPIMELMVELLPGLDENLKDSNSKSHKALIKYGMQEIKLTPEEIEVLKKKTRPLWDELADKIFPKELLNEVVFNLEEYRSSKAGK